MGYITGNIPGGYYGYKAANYLYDKKQNYMKRKYSGKSAGKRAMKRFRRATWKTRSIKKGAAGGGVTFQSDSTTQYVKKSMARGKKRSWKKFVKKVNAVDEKDYGKQTILISRQFQYGPEGQYDPSEVLLQHWGGMFMYGVKTTDAMGQTEGFNDVYNILNTDWDNRERVVGIATVGGNQVTSYGSKLQSKYIFTSACMDITFTNNTVFSGPNVTNVNTVATMEIDVYEIGFRKSNTNATLQNIQQGLQTGSAPNVDTVRINTSGGLEPRSRGVTLFELPTFLSLYGVKVYKKTKFMIPKGHSFTYQKRDPKRRYFDYFNVDRQNESTAPGITKGIVFCWKYTSPESLNTNFNYLEPRLNVRCSRIYKYIKKENNTDRGQLL